LFYVHELPESASVAQPKSSLMHWHERLGHLNEASLQKMTKDDVALGVKFQKSEKLGICEVCIKGKQTQTPFPNSEQPRTTKLLEIVHTDVCGPMKTMSKAGAKYFAVFVDDFSRWCEVFFLAKKSDVFDAFKSYKAWAEKSTGEKIKCLQSDNGTEFVNTEFNDFLDQHGIKRRLSVPHTPQQNGLAERKNRTLVETARCMLLQ
jgi:hypothetical protein